MTCGPLLHAVHDGVTAHEVHKRLMERQGSLQAFKMATDNLDVLLNKAVPLPKRRCGA